MEVVLHPELDAEQAYIDFAYECLARARERASDLQSMVEVGRGGTEQARFEREVIYDTIAARLVQLHLGDATLCFGRIDTEPQLLTNRDSAIDTFEYEGLAGEHGRMGFDSSTERWSSVRSQPRPAGPSTFYIGRVAVSDPNQEVVVVDWRAPIAEPFYRATGRVSMGLARRRHFATRGAKLLGLEDELFGDRALGLGVNDGISGHGALMSALSAARSGQLGDIVATIQGEQDEIIRAPMPGVLVVQGGPGTGKTVVALHRAAYLLYTHRFPLEDQGVLVVGPNRVFLGYIEQVLPSLGEAGVELAVLGDLVDPVRVKETDAPLSARVKGDARMVQVLAKAVRDRKRPLSRDLVIDFGLTRLRVSVAQSERIVDSARRRSRYHNSGRRFVEEDLFEVLARSSRTLIDASEVQNRVRKDPLVREALERMWPILTPAQFLHDLFGSTALLTLAGRRWLRPDEIDALNRPRSESVDKVIWKVDDVPLLDEARALLGATPKAKRQGGSDQVRTYGHIVVDEAQDLSPMQLRMLARRSLNGSMTVVGDIAQSTGAWAHGDWEEVLSLLPRRREPTRTELTVGYRIPSPNMDLAARVLKVAAPSLAAPRSVRQEGREPVLRRVEPAQLNWQVGQTVLEELRSVGAGNLAVIVPGSMVRSISEGLTRSGVEHGVASERGLAQQVTVVAVGMVKGLELDATVVVEPAMILNEEMQPMRSLYVALTRATKLLTIVYSQPLPDVLRPL